MKGTVNAPGSGSVNAKPLQDAAAAAQAAAEKAAADAAAARRAAENAASAASNAQNTANDAKTAAENAQKAVNDMDLSGYMPKTGGTFEGTVSAGSDNQTADEYLLRNSKLSLTEETPSVAGQVCWELK